MAAGDDEAHRCGVGLTLEGRVGGFSHVGGAVHPVGYGCPVSLGYGLDDVAQPGVLADVMEKRTSILRQTATMAWV